MARLKLSKHARLYRMALFADGRIPTYDEVWEAYEVILAMPGCAGYTRRTHSNWSTNRWRRRRSSPRPRAIIAAKLQENPCPNIVEVAGWALEAHIADVEAFRLVGELLPEAVKAQARFEHSLKPFVL